jgi:hypothetical protein
MLITSTGNSKKQWYGELFAMTTSNSLLLYTANLLRSIGENDKADQIMEKFDQISGNDSRGELLQKKLHGCH